MDRMEMRARSKGMFRGVGNILSGEDRSDCPALSFGQCKKSG